MQVRGSGSGVLEGGGGVEGKQPHKVIMWCDTAQQADANHQLPCF